MTTRQFCCSWSKAIVTTTRQFPCSWSKAIVTTTRQFPCSWSKAIVMNTAQSEIKQRRCVFSYLVSTDEWASFLLTVMLGHELHFARRNEPPVHSLVYDSYSFLRTLLRFVRLIMPISRRCHWCHLGCLHETPWRSSH